MRGYGKLRGKGLVCSRCKLDPVMREMRGCGKAPVGPFGEWNADTFAKGAAAKGYTKGDVATQAPEEFYLATYGGVWDKLGWLWDKCPQYYVAPEFADPEVLLLADEVLELKQLTKSGALSNVGDELTPAGVRLFVTADRLWQHLQSEFEDEQLAQARKNGGTKSNS